MRDRLDVTIPESFAHLDAVSKHLAKSQIVPPAYMLKPANCMIALQMAARIGCDALQVMQNLHVIQGKPSFGATFLMAVWNSCGRFTPIRFAWQKDSDGKVIGCQASSTEIESGDKLEGMPVTLEMAEAEGWSTKKGSKWVTMPQQMLSYRAAAFLVRAYAPEMTLGLHTSEEMRDISPAEQPTTLRGNELEKVAEAAGVATAGGTVDEVIDVDCEPVAEKQAESAEKPADDCPFDGDVYATIKAQRVQLGITDEVWLGILAKRNAKKTADLTPEQAEEIRRSLWSKLSEADALKA